MVLKPLGQWLSVVVCGAVVACAPQEAPVFHSGPFNGNPTDPGSSGGSAFTAGSSSGETCILDFSSGNIEERAATVGEPVTYDVRWENICAQPYVVQEPVLEASTGVHLLEFHHDRPFPMPILPGENVGLEMVMTPQETGAHSVMVRFELEPEGTLWVEVRLQASEPEDGT